MTAVTPSKQWIHFFRSDRCPPTSYILDSVSRGISDLKLLECELPAFELCLDDSRSFDPSVKNILLGWFVVGVAQSLDFIQVTWGWIIFYLNYKNKLFRGVVQLIFPSSSVTLSDSPIIPKLNHKMADISCNSACPGVISKSINNSGIYFRLKTLSFTQHSGEGHELLCYLSVAEFFEGDVQSFHSLKAVIRNFIYQRIYLDNCDHVWHHIG